eukprot:123868-Rhodomonas_salina.1
MLLAQVLDVSEEVRLCTCALLYVPQLQLHVGQHPPQPLALCLDLLRILPSLSGVIRRRVLGGNEELCVVSLQCARCCSLAVSTQTELQLPAPLLQRAASNERRRTLLGPAPVVHACSRVEEECERVPRAFRHALSRMPHPPRVRDGVSDRRSLRALQRMEPGTASLVFCRVVERDRHGHEAEVLVDWSADSESRREIAA